MSEEPIDWSARELAMLIVMSGRQSRTAGGGTLAEWWDRVLRYTRKNWQHRLARKIVRGRDFAGSPVGRVLSDIGIEPTIDNYRELVNAGRKRIMPRSKPL